MVNATYQDFYGLQKNVLLKKTYGDFKRLDQFVKGTI